jgi:hypothetical protein
MKRISTFFSLFLVAGMFAATAQTVPNAGFETWTNVNTATTWKSNNTTIYFLRQSTDKHGGTYAAEISSKANGSAGNLSGILTLGNVNITTQAVTGGYPIASKPTDLHGWYKYTAGNAADNMLITVTFTKWTGTSRLTLCNASFNSPVGQTIAAYTQFTIPLTYSPTTITPDSFNIVIKSSKTTAVVGTIALVDDLAFTPATSGFEEAEVFVPAMWPNPANEMVNLNLNGEVFDITVSNVIGQSVYSTRTNNEHVVIETNQLPTGLYYVNVENKNHHYTMKLLINR